MKSMLSLFCCVLVPACFGAAAPPDRSSANAAQLLAKGRAQFLAGEPAAAAETLRRAETLAPADRDVRDWRIRAEAVAGDAARRVSGAELLGDVAGAWLRPPPARDAAPEPRVAESAGLRTKLEAIRIAAVSFNAAPLSRVVPALATLSRECDPAADETKRGVNVVLIDPAGGDPAVTIALRDLPLRRVLELVTESVGYQFEASGDVVLVRPAGAKPVLATEVFTVARATVLRMLAANPAPRTEAAKRSGETRSEKGEAPEESGALRAFFQEAGIDFENTPGSGLVYDGAALIVTHSGRNLERLHTLLARYRDVRQVEIEAKFMEVQEGALEELGVQWSLARRRDPATGQPRELYRSPVRALAEAFAGTSGSSSILIDGAEVARVGTPGLPGAVSLGDATAPLAQLSGFIGEFDVSAVVRALAQKQGTDLLSAPKVTVLSGVEATISVAQELRYPRQFGTIQSQVGTTSGQNNGSAGVTITAGTPQDFTSQNIGVELRVRPRVEDDGAISLELNPVVTEFEGFVEYGGQSLAISGGRTVTIPSGFFQPIFSRRQVSTQVTLWDGATLVMGGLTREDVKKVSDKVPILGNLPAVGRFFRSKGESAVKRNLLIFVTARLVTPGGGPVRGIAPVAAAGATTR